MLQLRHNLDRKQDHVLAYRSQKIYCKEKAGVSFFFVKVNYLVNVQYVIVILQTDKFIKHLFLSDKKRIEINLFVFIYVHLAINVILD